MSSHRVVWLKKGVADVETFEEPLPAEGQVVLRTRVSLISPGTERAFFMGMPNAPCQFPTPAPGYSNVGEVVKLGPGVDSFEVGEIVVSPAGHASHVVVAAADCLLMPAKARDEDAVFFNLATIALQGIRKARVELAESVLVMGAGPIGLLAMQLARLNGALPVLVADKDEGRLKFALGFGADEALVANDKLQEAVALCCEGGGAAVVIEATGSPHAIVPALQCARRLGRVVLLGSTRGETEKVNFYKDVHQKGITIIGAHNGGSRPRHESSAAYWTARDDQRAVLRLLAAGRLNVQSLITHRFSWKEAVQAYNILASGDGSAQGMILDWRKE